MTDKKWQFWIDRGGTFTDVIARHPSGRLISYKYLSENPERYKDAAVFAMREIMQVDDNSPFPSEQVEAIKMGTTVATNALLERNGEPTLLLVTKGFKDALLIAQQHRDDLFAFKPTRPTPLYSRVEEVSERVGMDGDIITPFDEGACRQSLKSAFASGIKSVAIAFVHGYRHTDHEERAAELAREIGFTQISVSHKVSPLMKLVPRGDTTVADAYLSPILRRYVNQIKENVGDTPLYFMQSNGGLAHADTFEGKDAVLSGPAGGIVGAAKTGERADTFKLIGFDMGGTSTDVSHYGGTYERVTDTVVAGVRMTVPMMDIHTVAAGGGSICDFHDGRFRVGPASAGAFPGPAAYGRGGPITVTDCNVMLGKLNPDLFPAVFGKSGTEKLNFEATKAGFEKLQQAIQHETGNTLGLEEIAEGFLSVAIEHMARAIKRVSVERGHDIKKYALLTFGGAGGQHACLVADALGMTKVIVPPFSGVLSALGMGLADQRVIREQALECPLDAMDTLTDVSALVSNDAANGLEAQGVPLSGQTLHRSIRAKYKGTDTTLTIPFGELSDMITSFEAQHKKQFGFIESGQTIIAEAMEVETIGGSAQNALGLTADGHETEASQHLSTFMNGENVSAAVYNRHTLKPNHFIKGPAVITENGGTTIVEPGWHAVVDKKDTLQLARYEARSRQDISADAADPIMLEVFNNLFMSVAEEMGGILAKTAHSVNVKERLDFSCAVFDADGNLIANAPHMPVHLGSMGDSVAAVVEENRNSIKPGDVYMLNDPYAGGTHLPDITVITPVFLDAPTPAYYVASRGHHADIGGTTPGSMPSNSTRIEEEGIRFTNFELVKEGIFQEDALKTALKSGPYPTRNVTQNIADLKAQIAANERGVSQVKHLVDDFGADVVSSYMGHVQNNAEEAVRRVIDKLQDGVCEYPMDCGAVIKVKITVDKKARTATVDFTGASTIQNNNYNAPLAVTKAATLYVFRVLTGDDIPLNAGCLKPINLIVPEGCMLNPTPPAAVVAGNVETSQAITNALFIATKALAASQGTMNNFTFGNDTYQYYETIAGGTGAGNGFTGTDAIQSHMTNSRLTDVEVLEWRYPVILEDFSVRENSGGKGAYAGGNGVVRKVRFKEAMEMTILSNHRDYAPPGLSGGNDGKTGETSVLRTDGKIDDLKYADHAVLKAGDCVLIKTPGGGGYGTKN
ncbi:hydantoinase B/oxoprolinase family protein [Kordiimonas sp. SCSIO 12610]|uniref:hydantoinase B/oxoprolinase family protein n=1 Tax=Kordiimonas sp. SCSIO 12610 TaxID=2829597 RepID=UPI00210D90D3|nr:hydantoinase B/oxoprolinase family protein [Kordiimonas sp. SCSIO 12610]UTW56372.1 hydantoinase B/oxoprolinase family protein [Kordiimonas sp. SCSIO 12610]